MFHIKRNTECTAKWIWDRFRFSTIFQSNTTVCLIIHVFCKSCEPEIVFVLICTLAEQFHFHKSYKMRESTLSGIGNFEENMDLSGILLAVKVMGSNPGYLLKSFLLYGHWGMLWNELYRSTGHIGIGNVLPIRQDEPIVDVYCKLVVMKMPCHILYSEWVKHAFLSYDFPLICN